MVPIFFPDAELEDAKVLRKLAARLRKRYSRARDSLREMATEAELQLRS